MMLCVRSVNYSVQVNDDLVGPIVPSQGLRQGEPLSPYLFILCAEGLSAALNLACMRDELHGNKICRQAPSVSHLLFTDDCILFCRATPEEGMRLKQVIINY